MFLDGFVTQCQHDLVRFLKKILGLFRGNARVVFISFPIFGSLFIFEMKFYVETAPG
jgi:hypothetical protein